MKLGVVLTLSAFGFCLSGCSSPLVSIRVDAYPGAKVTLLAGLDTEERTFTAPFVGNFEGTSVGARARSPLTSPAPPPPATSQPPSTASAHSPAGLRSPRRRKPRMATAEQIDCERSITARLL